MTSMADGGTPNISDFHDDERVAENEQDKTASYHEKLAGDLEIAENELRELHSNLARIQESYGAAIAAAEIRCDSLQRAMSRFHEAQPVTTGAPVDPLPMTAKRIYR